MIIEMYCITAGATDCGVAGNVAKLKEIPMDTSVPHVTLAMVMATAMGVALIVSP